MSKYAQIEGLTEFVVNLRDQGVAWDKEGGIVTQVQATFPAYTTKSAIPLRKLYHAAKAEGNQVKATKARVIAARKAGKGWHQISVQTGATVAELKKLAGDNEVATGRVYVSGDGSHRVVDLAEVKAAKANTPKPTTAQYSAARG